MLRVENLHVYYGAIHALQGVSFDVEKGEIVTLIGANGAGKSTILRTLSGILRPREGSIVLNGQEISSVPAEKIVKLGMSQVPEGRRIFAPLTVKENILMGAYTRTDQAEIHSNRSCRRIASPWYIAQSSPDGAHLRAWQSARRPA